MNEHETMNNRSGRSVTKTRPELVGLFRPPVPQAGRYDKLRLDKNEHVTGFPPRVIRQMLGGITPHFLAAYPEPGPLYAKIAKRHRVGVENVLVTSGSEIAIRYLFEAYLDRGDEIVFLNPAFAMFDVYATLCGAKKVTVDCGPDLQQNPNKILERITNRTKLVAIDNPNNPTGSVIAPVSLRKIAVKAASKGALLLVDEAYFDFYQKTMLSHLKQHENVIVTRTFSKACGLASVRLGYAIAQRPIIEEVRKMQPIDHANAFALKCGEYILDHPEIISRYAAEVKKGKAFVEREAHKLGIRTMPSHANFLILDVGSHREALLAAAQERGILLATHVRLPSKNNFVRIALGPTREMRRFVATLKSAVRD